MNIQNKTRNLLLFGEEISLPKDPEKNTACIPVIKTGVMFQNIARVHPFSDTNMQIQNEYCIY